MRLVASRRSSESEPAARETSRPQQRDLRLSQGRGPVYVVVVGRFVTNVGMYFVLPFLAVYLVQDEGVSSLQAGILFAVLNFTRRGLGIPAGWASDRFGASRILVLGLVVEVAAYVAFYAGSSFPAFLQAVALLGTGGSLNNMASRSLLATTRATSPSTSDGSEDEGSDGVVVNFSLYYVMINVAALVGPLIGSVLLSNGLMALSFVLAALLHLLFAAGSAVLLRGIPPATTAGGGRSPREMIDVLRDRHLVRYCLLAVGGWFLITQFHVALPLSIAHQGEPGGLVGPLIATNAVVVILTVWLFGKRLERRSTEGRLAVLSLSGVVMGVGWLCGAVDGVAALVVVVVVASVGEALFCGVVDAGMAGLAPPGRVGLYLGYSSMAWAAGGVLGSLVGGSLSWAARHDVLLLYWLVLASVGFVTAAGIRLSRDFLASAIARRSHAADQPVAT
jgi:MFS transporter, DHA1 family, multidrug resistance protein